MILIKGELGIAFHRGRGWEKVGGRGRACSPSAPTRPQSGALGEHALPTPVRREARSANTPYQHLSAGRRVRRARPTNTRPQGGAFGEHALPPKHGKVEEMGIALL